MTHISRLEKPLFKRIIEKTSLYFWHKKLKMQEETQSCLKQTTLCSLIGTVRWSKYWIDMRGQCFIVWHPLLKIGSFPGIDPHRVVRVHFIRTSKHQYPGSHILINQQTIDIHLLYMTKLLLCTATCCNTAKDDL